MKVRSRNCLLVVAVLLLLCVSDHVIWLIIPPLLKRGYGQVMKAYGTALKVYKIVHQFHLVG